MTRDDEVDWEAIFRTIDHQGSVARVPDQSGTTAQDGNGNGKERPESRRAQSGVEVDNGESILAQYATYLREQGHAEQQQQAESSTQSQRARERTDSLRNPNVSTYGRSGAGPSGPVALSPYDSHATDSSFRAMLRSVQGLSSQSESTPRELREHDIRGGKRRRSYSLVPRRRALDAIPSIPLFTPQPALSASDDFPFSTAAPSNRIQAQAGAPLPPELLEFLTESLQRSHEAQHPWASTTTTPAPTPFQAYPGLAAGSNFPTPLPSPRGTVDIYDPTPPSTSQSGGTAPTPGAEADGEDKRVRNTLASARFRAKRKARLAEVEQQINHLEGRSKTLQRQVEDLRKENVFLKEMVQLKYGLDVDKRL